MQKKTEAAPVEETPVEEAPAEEIEIEENLLKEDEPMHIDEENTSDKKEQEQKEEICERLRHDKKVSGDKISVVRVKEIGTFTIEKTDINTLIEEILK